MCIQNDNVCIFFQVTALEGSMIEMIHCLWLQILLMKEYTLPIMLLTQAANQSAGTGLDEIEGMTRRPVANPFQPFVEIFMQCTQFPDAIAKVLVPVIERQVLKWVQTFRGLGFPKFIKSCYYVFSLKISHCFRISEYNCSL